MSDQNRSIVVVLNGQTQRVSPRIATMLAEVLARADEIDAYAVGILRLRFAQGTVTPELTKSFPPATIRR